MGTDAQLRKVIDEVTARLTDEGKLIEAGWAGLQLMSWKDAPAEQLAELRMCFFAGAHHLFASIMTVLDPGPEPTDRDLDRMSLIQRELDTFIREFKRRHHLDN